MSTRSQMPPASRIRAFRPPAWLAGVGGSLMRFLARSERISNRKLRASSSWAPRYPSAREGFSAALAAGRGA